MRADAAADIAAIATALQQSLQLAWCFCSAAGLQISHTPASVKTLAGMLAYDVSEPQGFSETRNLMTVDGRQCRGMQNPAS